MALSYLTASPRPFAMAPVFVFTVSHDARSAIAGSVNASSLEDMAIILFKAGGLALSRTTSAGRGRRRSSGWRRRRRRCSAREPADRRHTSIGVAVEEQIGLMRGSGKVSREFQRLLRHGSHQMRRDDD